MAQVNIVSRMGAFYVGEESTFGTTPSMNRGFVIDTPTFEADNTHLEVPDYSSKMFDHRTKVKGLQSASVSVAYGLRPNSTLYNTGASPTDYWEAQLLQAAFGGHYQAAGSTILAASTTTLVKTNAHGSRFQKGQWVGVETGGSGGTIEYAKVTNITGDDLSVFPTLTGTPFTGGIILNGDNFFLAEQYTTPTSMQVADAQESTAQWTFNGGRCDSIEFSTARNEIIRVSQKFAFAKSTGPSSQSLSTAVASDNTRAHMALVGATTLFQTTATSTRTHYTLESFQCSLTPGMVHLPDLGGTGGCVGIMRSAPRMAATAKLKFRYDQSVDSSWWTNQTDVQAIVIIPVGSGTTQRAVIFDLGACQIVGKPQVSDDGGRRVMNVTLEAKLDTRVTSPSADNAYSPLCLALI